MADLMTVIQSIRKIDVDLSLVKAALQRYVPTPRHRLSGKSRKQTRPDKETQPPWVEAISLQLSTPSTELKDIKRELQRGWTLGDSHGDNVNSDEQDAAQDARLRTSEQPRDREQQQAPKTPTPLQSTPNDESSATVSDTEARQQRPDGLPLIGIDSSAQQLSEPHKASQTPPSGTTSSLDSCQTGYAEARHEAVVHTTPSPLVSGEPLSSAGQLNFNLSIEEMGEELVPSIMQLVQDNRFTGILSVQGIEEVDWTHLTRSIQPPPKDYDLFGVEYSKPYTVEGVAKQGLSNSKKFIFPDFSQPVEEPSREACQEYLRQLINNPPKSTIPYYVGPPLMPTTFNQLLHPGEALLKIPRTEGVNTVYWHAGEKGSGTAFHCEDMKLYSVNLVLYGWKLWIVIRLRHTEKFEAFVKKHWPSNGCDQFVRHNSLLISMETLQHEGIEFDIHIAGPAKWS